MCFYLCCRSGESGPFLTLILCRRWQPCRSLRSISDFSYESLCAVAAARERRVDRECFGALPILGSKEACKHALSHDLPLVWAALSPADEN